MSSLVKCLFGPLSHFLFSLSYLSCFYISDISPLSDRYFAEIFFHSDLSEIFMDSCLTKYKQKDRAYNKLENICTVKDTVIKMKSSLTEWKIRNYMEITQDMEITQVLENG